MELEGIFLILAFASLSKGILLQLPTLWSAIRFILVFPLHIGVYFTLKLLTYFPLIMQDLDLTFSRTREYKFLAVSGEFCQKLELDHIQMKQNIKNRDIFVVFCSRDLDGETTNLKQKKKEQVYKEEHYTHELILTFLLSSTFLYNSP